MILRSKKKGVQEIGGTKKNNKLSKYIDRLLLALILLNAFAIIIASIGSSQSGTEVSSESLSGFTVVLAIGLIAIPIGLLASGFTKRFTNEKG